MKKEIFTALFLCCTLLLAGCKRGKQPADQMTKEPVSTTLFDKPLSEIKELVDGKWELVSGQNDSEFNEFENTFILFDGDRYAWIEDGQEEKGDLNWRKADTGAGYEAYLTDVFYEAFPSYPVAIKGDTLYIQDCTVTAYRYTLVRRR
ncbi:MAG: hypothetical protein LBQ39_02445 [Tannerellaceae bacterium]|jgi:hypothetical protein|nr:hypothetical protein [Tannerellaceae bacterium]